MGRAPAVSGRALQLGTLVHRALELWYGDQSKPSSECVDQAIAELSDQQQLAHYAYGIMQNYVLWAAKHDDFEPISQEQEFAVPLFDDHMFAGRWDLVVMRHGKIWINDFKITGAQFDSYSQYLYDQDEQARGYSWAGRQIYGSDFGGIMFTLVRSKAPEKPAILKNGGVSRNKQCTTTWDIYRQSILDEGDKPADYQDMQEHFDSKPFIMRAHISLGPRPLKAFEQRVIATAMEMLKPDVLIYPNANVMSCRMCAFKFPCSVYHSVGEKAATQILFTEYTESKYAINAADTDTSNSIMPGDND